FAGLKDLPFERGVSLILIGRKGHSGDAVIGLATELALQDIIAKAGNMSARATMIVIGEIELRWLECLPVVIEALGVGADEFIDALLRIGESNDVAFLAEGLHDLPLVVVGVLELDKDDKGVGFADQRPDFPAAAQDLAR